MLSDFDLSYTQTQSQPSNPYRAPQTPRPIDSVVHPQRTHAILLPPKPALLVTQSPNLSPEPAVCGRAGQRLVVLLRWDPRVCVAGGGVQRVPRQRGRLVGLRDLHLRNDLRSHALHGSIKRDHAA
nr:hypothetical protein CFP56_54591 [Quercus suber]